MPSYPGASGATVPVASNASPIALQKGESAYVFGVLAATASQLPINEGNVALETVANAVSQASIAVCIQSQQGDYAPGLSIEIRFPSTPGAGGTIKIQEADTDADAFYLTMSNSAYTIDVSGGALVFRVDLIPTGGKFLRLLYTKGANNVTLWAKITRLS